MLRDTKRMLQRSRRLTAAAAGVGGVGAHEPRLRLTKSVLATRVALTVRSYKIGCPLHDARVLSMVTRCTQCQENYGIATAGGELRVHSTSRARPGVSRTQGPRTPHMSLGSTRSRRDHGRPRHNEEPQCPDREETEPARCYMLCHAVTRTTAVAA